MGDIRILNTVSNVLRLEELFNVSTSWSFEDIEPYVLDFVDSKKVYEFISKRCRSGTVGGKTVFYRL